MKKINILDIKISDLSKTEILTALEESLSSKKPYFWTTPNAEIILAAQKDKKYGRILNTADFSIPDSISLKFASWAMGKNLQIFPGADLLKEILQICDKEKYKILILHKKNALSSKEDIEKYLKKNYSGIDFEVIVSEAPLIRGVWGVLNFLQNSSKPSKPPQPPLFQPEADAAGGLIRYNAIICSFGAPEQEKIIYELLKKEKIDIKIGIGVGGAFDFLTGKTKRAPKIMRKIGLEWLWRLFFRPNWRKKTKRIWRAVIVFPVKFLFWRIFKKTPKSRL